MELNKGDKFYFARVISDEVIELTIRTVYEHCIVGVYQGNAHVISTKNADKLLYTDRKLAVKYLKEHKIIFREEEIIEDEN